MATGSRRVFFALRPDALAARQLGEAARRAQARHGGRRTRREALHLTLAFVGAVAAPRLAELRDLAATLRQPPFDIQLDAPRCLPAKGIFWLGASRPPPQLGRLAESLAARLRAAGFPVEDRPFEAHVTLLRQARCGQDPQESEGYSPVKWAAREFVLAESELRPQGARYAIIGRWPLAQS